MTNATGTEVLACNCGSWLAHWSKHSGHAPAQCSVSGCNDFAVDAALVRSGIGIMSAMNLDIVPVCATHNGTLGYFELKPDTRLVSARCII